MKTNILLETGTNELEIIEFYIDSVKDDGNVVREYFGINVAKVREIIKAPKMTDVPKSDPNVEGMINLRGEIIPMINLAKWLELKTASPMKKVIITEFNNMVNGFLVNDVTRIYRINWKDVIQPNQLALSKTKNCITSVARIEEKLILILDFEKIIADIFPELSMPEVDEKKFDLKDKFKGKKVLIAEDSPGIRDIMRHSLEKVGFEVISTSNGQEALAMLDKFLKEARKQNISIKNFVDVIVTDLEMPGIDGAYLVRKIRELPEFESVPIIVFSSMASEANKRKLYSIGANRFLGKPELPRLIEIISELI